MKKEQDVCILAHAYQGQEILEVADYMGDSYGLSVQGAKSNCKGVIMCGVRFMAETCKVLSPEKKVWLANPSAGCPMAEQLDLEGLRKLKAEHPDHTVVAYINTTSEARKAHPEELLLVHPECRQEVVEQADYIGSTTGIIDYAKKSDAKEFIIGTENSIVEHLQFACPDKQFYPLSVMLTCMNMIITTLMDIYNCLKGTGGEVIELPQNVVDGAGRCIHRMVELGG